MINFKQLELANQMYETLYQRYPDVELVNVVESGVYPDHLWVRLRMPTEEEKNWEVRQLAGEISIDLLTQYGYHITILSVATPKSPFAQV
jgi:hypothetical protein